MNFVLRPRLDGDERTIVVMGVQRGGTSMVAGALRELGLFMGEGLGTNHEDPSFLSRDLSELRPVVASRNAAHPVWGWKMPHSSEYIAEFESELRNPHLVFIFRNPYSSALSQMKHSGAAFGDGMKFSINRLSQLSEAVAQCSSPTLLTGYEDALTDPGSFIDALVDFCALSPTDEQRQSAARFIDPELGYQPVSKEFAAIRVTTPTAGNERLPCVRTTPGIDVADGVLRLVEGSGEIRFRPAEGEQHFPERFVLRCRRLPKSSSAKVRVLYGFEGRFSHNQADEILLNKGQNALEVTTSGLLTGIALIPDFDGRGVSSVDQLFLESLS